MSDSPNGLKVSVEEPRSWARRLTITVPASRIDQERREVARKLAQRVRLPGFRKGRVPTGVVEKRFGPAIDHETVEKVVGEAYREVLEQHQFQPITQGEVGELDYKPGADLTFRVEFEVRPDVQLQRLSGFKLARDVQPVQPEAVDEVLQSLRQQQAEWSPLEGSTPTAGDMVRIEIVALDQAEAKPRSYQIVLGDGQAVPDIEDAVRTLAPGESGEFTIRTSEDAAAEGSPAEQRIRLQLIEALRPQLPTLDDEFARSVGDFEDLAALRNAVQSDLERQASSQAEQKLRHELIDRILEANPFDVPASMVNQYLDRLLQPRERIDAAQLAQLREVTAPAAERGLKRMIVIEKVAETQNLHATPEEVDARVEALAERQGRSPAETWAQLQKSGRLAGLEEEITEEKVFEFLLSQSIVS
jgi:trigger factor